MTEAEWTRIMARVQPDANGCLIWPGATGGNKSTRYAVATIGGKVQLVHRAVFEHVHGFLPKGRKNVVEHTCQRSLCIEPSHLQVTSQKRNLLRGPTTLNSIHASKTHCSNGHKFTPENTRVTARQRVCKACKREWAQKHREQLRGKI